VRSVRLGDAVFLVAARAGRIIVLDKAEGSGFLRAAPRVGATVPAHATAVGKLFLAFGGGAIAMPRGAQKRFSEHTLTDVASLKVEIALTAERGYAESVDEWIPGLSVVAAPVFASASDGRMLAALAFAAPTQRMQSLGIGAIARRSIAAAERIAARLAGTCS
jgi:IclR family acetate operon transcriptional repressor